MDKKELGDKRALFKAKKTGVLMGGLSEEREISLKSGAAVHEALAAEGYRAVAIDVGRDVAERLAAEQIEVAFIALHGRYGEDGVIQGVLEMQGVPYTGSGVLASALAMDKAAAKHFFRSTGIPTPEFTVLRRGQGGAGAPPGLPLPVIVKPARQGSTIGLTLVTDEGGYGAAVDEAFRYDDTALVERFIEGRELTVSMLDGTVFPVIEIVPKGKAVYDYTAKYVKGMSDFRVPAELDKGVETEVKRAAEEAYRALGCRGAARADIMLGKGGAPYVLEVNTVPGMTGLSLLPMAAKSAGIGYRALVELMLLGAGLDKH